MTKYKEALLYISELQNVQRQLDNIKKQIKKISGKWLINPLTLIYLMDHKAFLEETINFYKSKTNEFVATLDEYMAKLEKMEKRTTPEAMWQAFVDKLNEGHSDKDKQINFLGSIDKYKEVFLEANKDVNGYKL